MANIITGGRIICSFILLFLPAMSPEFFEIYLLAGVSDMIDGTIARKTNAVSEFGAKFDTVADFLFVMICVIKLLPALAIPMWLGIWTGIIALIKIINLCLGYAKQQGLVAVHTIANKVTGGLLFLFPFTVGSVDLKYSGSVICVIATVAAVREGYVICVSNGLRERRFYNVSRTGNDEITIKKYRI